MAMRSSVAAAAAKEEARRLFGPEPPEPVPSIQSGTIDQWKATTATKTSGAGRRRRRRRACGWLPFASSSSPFPRLPGDRLEEDPFMSALPSPAEQSALDRRLVNDCLELYNSTHPGDEYEPASGVVTEYSAFAASGCWTHGNFVARGKRRPAAGRCFGFASSLLPPVPRTLFFFELVCSDHFDGVVTCVPLDEPVTEARCFRGLRLGWGARRDGSKDCVCRTCYRRVVDGPRSPRKTFACGHDGKAERVCEIC